MVVYSDIEVGAYALVPHWKHQSLEGVYKVVHTPTL
jgi:hypothetical protein